MEKHNDATSWRRHVPDASHRHGLLDMDMFESLT